MRTTLLLCLLVGIPHAALAQAGGPPRAAGAGFTSHNTGFGVKAGLSWGDLQSTQDPLLVSSFDYLRTFQAGAYAQRGFTRRASVQAELLYSRKGYQGDSYNRPIGAEPSTRLDYLALPVLFVVNLTDDLSLHLGPQAAVLLAARSAGQQLSVRQSGYQRFELGGVLGAEARVGPARLGLRYDYSFATLNRSGLATTAAGQPLQSLAPDNNYHNLVLQAYLGIGLAH